jgi:hypothetical protein
MRLEFRRECSPKYRHVQNIFGDEFCFHGWSKESCIRLFFILINFIFDHVLNILSRFIFSIHVKSFCLPFFGFAYFEK